MQQQKDLDQMTDEEIFVLLSQAKKASSLPYIATPKQMEFHMHPARGASKAILYGGAIGGGFDWPRSIVI